MPTGANTRDSREETTQQLEERMKRRRKASFHTNLTLLKPVFTSRRRKASFRTYLTQLNGWWWSSLGIRRRRQLIGRRRGGKPVFTPILLHPRGGLSSGLRRLSLEECPPGAVHSTAGGEGGEGGGKPVFTPHFTLLKGRILFWISTSPSLSLSLSLSGGVHSTGGQRWWRWSGCYPS